MIKVSTEVSVKRKMRRQSSLWNTPSAVQEAITHDGTCTSESTTERAINSVTDEQCLRLKQLGPLGLTAIAYDNLKLILKLTQYHRQIEAPSRVLRPALYSS